MTIKQALEQIDNGTQEIPSNWHAGKGLSDGVTWAEVREWLATFLELPCNCDNGDAYGHHRWCDTYRPSGMSDAEWESALGHPNFGCPNCGDLSWACDCRWRAAE